MIVKAIVESYPDENSRVKVRIPKFHKLKDVATATASKDLPYATTASLPGIKPVYIPDDIVFVDFENEDVSKPVIVGKLNYKNDQVNSISNITAGSLIVNQNTTLSSETSVGTIDYSDLNYAVNGFINAPDIIETYFYSDIGNGNIRIITYNPHGVDPEIDAQEALGYARDSESWAVGQRNGIDVLPGDVTYHNNSKYYCEQAQHIADNMSFSINSQGHLILTRTEQG